MNWFKKKAQAQHGWYIADVASDIDIAGRYNRPPLKLKKNDIVAVRPQGSDWKIAPVANVYIPPADGVEKYKNIMEEEYKKGNIDQAEYEEAMQLVKDPKFIAQSTKNITSSHDQYVSDYNKTPYSISTEQAKQYLNSRRDENNKPLFYEHQSEVQGDIFYEPVGEAHQRAIKESFNKMLNSYAEKNRLEINALEQQFYKRNQVSNIDEYIDAMARSIASNSWSRGQGIMRSMNENINEGLRYASEQLKQEQNRSEHQLKMQKLRDRAKSMGMEICPRCGGAGGFNHWPGFTCFECDGLGMVDSKN